jgi:hypothetical protein
MIPIDKTFVLSLTPVHEKKRKLLESKLKSIPVISNVPWEIIELPQEEFLDEAIANNQLKVHDKQQIKTEWEEVSRAIGHWKAWQKAQAENHHSVLVLEEDFLPKGFHYHVLDAAPPCDLIYFGRTSHGGDIPFEGGLVQPVAGDGSFAYCIKSSGVSAFLSSGFDQQIIPVGEFMTTMHEGSSSDNGSPLYKGRISAVAPMKNFIEKDETWSSQGNDDGEPYAPLHLPLYSYGNSETEWVKKYLNRQLVQGEFDLICDEPINNVFSFPLFTPLFCREIIEEAEHYGRWTSYRGKDHDAIDIMLKSIGFDQIYSKVMKAYVYPLFCHKYQLQGDAWLRLNSQNFIVRYLADKQGHLGLHNDGSYLSMVVTLNTDHEGGGTFFPKFKKLIKHDQSGYASVHPGLMGYLHGARPVTKGKRYILASFFFPGAKPPISDGY